MTCDEAAELLAASSLNALEQDERDALEGHLKLCPRCAAELRGYAETAAQLGLALPPVEPPSALKRRVLARANERERGGWTGAGGPALKIRWPRLHPASLVAAAALVVALSATLWAAGLQVQLNEQRELVGSLRYRATSYDKVVAVLQSPDMQLRPLQGTELAPSAIGRLYVDPETGAGMMMVRSLPPLSAGRVYQLWWVRADGRRESGGIVTRTDGYGNGYAFVQCPAPLNTWQAVGLTEEPAGGSPGPTGQRLLGGPI